MLRIHPENVPYLRQTLLSLGFTPTVWQWHKPGQLFGLVYDQDPAQLHVRAFENGVIESEYEVARHYAEHHTWPSEDANGYVARILTQANIPYHASGLNQPRRAYVVPRRLTDLRPLAALAGLAALLILPTLFATNGESR